MARGACSDFQPTIRFLLTVTGFLAAALAGLGWIHEIKHDGFRSELLPSYSGDAASLVLPRLVSRNIGKLGRDWRASAGRRQPNSNWS